MASSIDYRAVRYHLRDVVEITHPSGTVYECGTLVTREHEWRVGLAEIGAGAANAAQQTERALAHFAPACIVFVGVSGGLRDVGLGDVVAATKVYGFEAGRDAGMFEPRPDVFRSHHRLEQRARAEARNPAWLARLTSSDAPPAVHVGPIAAGAPVIASTRARTREFLQKTYGDALAVEMEGHGFLAAVHSNDSAAALVVRGIANLLDDKLERDTDGTRERAAANAAAFAVEVVGAFLAEHTDAPRGMTELRVSFGLDKLIEAVAQGLGALAKPWMLRRVAKARADSARILAEAEVEIAEQLRLPATSSAPTGKPTDTSILEAPAQPGELLADAAETFEKRTEQRVLLREERRQRNLESIVLGAAHEISNIEEVSEDAIDDDWVARFFMDAQDVSDSRLQQLWARILAREVAKPRTTSLRTLEVLRNLSAAEAHLFQECLRCVCESDDLLFFLAAAGTTPWKNRHLMSDCGLFGLEINSSIRPDERMICRHGDIRIVMSPINQMMNMPWHVTIIHLSEAGKALARVGWRTPDPDKGLLEGLLESYAAHFNIEVEYLDKTLPLGDFLRGAMTKS